MMNRWWVNKLIMVKFSKPKRLKLTNLLSKIWKKLWQNNTTKTLKTRDNWTTSILSLHHKMITCNIHYNSQQFNHHKRPKEISFGVKRAQKSSTNFGKDLKLWSCGKMTTAKPCPRFMPIIDLQWINKIHRDCKICTRTNRAIIR